jgi:putative membrane protein
MMMGGMWLMGLFWLLLIGGGISLVVWAISGQQRSGSGTRQTVDDTALSTLRERFARGDIDETEYRERRRTLEGEQSAPR